MTASSSPSARREEERPEKRVMRCGPLRLIVDHGAPDGHRPSPIGRPGRWGRQDSVIPHDTAGMRARPKTPIRLRRHGGAGTMARNRARPPALRLAPETRGPASRPVTISHYRTTAPQQDSAHVNVVVLSSVRPTRWAGLQLQWRSVHRHVRLGVSRRAATRKIDGRHVTRAERSCRNSRKTCHEHWGCSSYHCLTHGPHNPRGDPREDTHHRFTCMTRQGGARTGTPEPARTHPGGEGREGHASAAAGAWPLSVSAC